MTDLHALANAIPTTSPNVRAFAQAVADTLQPASTVDTSGLFYTGVKSSNPRWFEPIVNSPKLSPNSSALVQAWQQDGTPLLTLRRYCVPVYRATPSDPKHDVRVTKYPPSAGNVLKAVPIPANAAPAPGSDGHMCIVTDTCMYDFWQAVKAADGSWSCGAAIAGPCPSQGGYVNAGCRASGVPLALGMVRAEEIQGGEIRHALGFSAQRQGNRVLLPTVGGGAFFSGGTEGTFLATHCGTRIQLDPMVDLTSVPAGAQRVIAKALQVYGAFMIDGGGGGLGFGGVGPMGWDSTGITGDYLNLTGIPWGRLRVLDYSAAVVSPAQRDELNPCSVWGKA